MSNTTYEFTSFGFDGTHRGPTDFYDRVRGQIGQAFRCGLDFDTGWMGCKHEILSSRITRRGASIEVEVSVTDDFDTCGMGRGSFRVTSRTKEDTFFNKLEKAGACAHAGADQELKANSCYVGYSVGRIRPDGLNSWELTYLVNRSDWYDTRPPGYNYYRWGWQEVEERDEDVSDARPAEIPVETAEALEEGMMALKPKIQHGEWQATEWDTRDEE